MPHVFQLVTQEGRQAIIVNDGSIQTFNRRLARLVGMAYQELIDETVDVATQVRVHPAEPTTSMPVALTIVVVLWHTGIRDGAAHHLEMRLAHDLFDDWPGIPLKVCVNVVKGIAPFDSASQPPIGA